MYAALRKGPGYDDNLPHDAAHFLVEAETGLFGGAFGRVASGRNNIFWPTNPVARQRQKRRESKRLPSKAEHADMAWSETLASVCAPLWEVRAGHQTELPIWFSRVESNLSNRLWSNASWPAWTSSPNVGMRFRSVAASPSPGHSASEPCAIW